MKSVQLPGNEAENITQLLVEWRQGDAASLEQLMEKLHDALYLIARHQFIKEAPNHTLQATALINELYLRLADGLHVDWQNRAHFFAISAKIMKRILIDYARKRMAAGEDRKVSLTMADFGSQGISTAIELIDLDRFLEELKEKDKNQYDVVTLRFFGGLTLEEIAEVTRCTKRTAQRRWSAARLWLLARVRGVA